MESYVFDDVMDFSETSYLVKTLNSEAQKRIISSVFRSGSLIYSRYESYNGTLSEDQLFTRVRSYHEHARNNVDALFKFSRRYASTREIGKRILLVRAFMKNQMYSEALAEIKTILEFNANLSVLHFYEGKIHLQLAEYEAAAQSLLQAIRLKEDFADYHFCLGRAYLRLDKCKGAIAEFTRAVKLNAYYSEACFYLGLAYLRNAIIKEDFELARDVVACTCGCFRKSVQLYPDFKNQQFVDGENLLREGKLEEAFNKLSAVVFDRRNDRGQTFILDFYIKYLGEEDCLSVQEIEEHIGKLQALLKKFNNYADLHHELGIANLILAKSITRRAIAAFRGAVEINPGYAEAQRMLQHLLSNKNGLI